MVAIDFKVKQDTHNPMLKRKELSLEIDHEKEGSPSRVAVREAVAAKYGTKMDNVYVVGILTRTGSQHSLCDVQVYDNPESAKKVVPKHIQIRNLPAEERKKVMEESKKAEEKPKVEKAKVESKAKGVKPELKQTEPTKEAKTETKPTEVAKGAKPEGKSGETTKPKQKEGDTK